MGSSDISPPHVPSWVVPASTGVLGIGVIFWDLFYILVTRRSLRTKSYGLPVVVLALNVAWEIIYAFYVTEQWLELVGFAVWLLLDIGLIYTTILFAPNEWTASPWIGRWMAWIFAALVAVGVLGQWSFARWWLSRPGIGHGDKAGKWYYGVECIDTTEIAFWSAAVNGLLGSAGSLMMLAVRGHSGGTDYKSWFCRTIGTLAGMVGCNGILWYWWPEAHGYFVNPFGMFLLYTTVSCDLIYPLLLWHVRATEKELPDGRLVSGEVYASFLQEGKKKE